MFCQLRDWKHTRAPSTEAEREISVCKSLKAIDRTLNTYEIKNTVNFLLDLNKSKINKRPGEYTENKIGKEIYKQGHAKKS